MKIVLVHGFNVRDGGASTVDKLTPYLEQQGHQIDKDDADYGFFSLWMVRFRKHKAILRIAEALKEADVVIAHSNGANYVLKALKFVHPPKQVIFLSPAANRRSKVPVSATKVDVFHTRTDFWVFLSGFLPFKHPWGWMGLKGTKGNDPRITNHDYTDIVKSHSDWFDDAHVATIARAVAAVL